MSVYLTAVNITDQRDQNNDEQSAASSRTKSLDMSPQKTTTKNTNSCFLTKNHEKFEKTTSMMLDYLVNEETHYTDMIKIEDYFKNKTIEDYKIYNFKQDEINKKREMLQKLEDQINEV